MAFQFPSTETPQEALTLELSLSISAPDDTKAKACAQIAESIAQTLDIETVEHCKRRANVLVAALLTHAEETLS